MKSIITSFKLSKSVEVIRLIKLKLLPFYDNWDSKFAIFCCYLGSKVCLFDVLSIIDIADLKSIIRKNFKLID